MTEENTATEEVKTDKRDSEIADLKAEVERLRQHADKVLSEKKEADRKKREAEEERERIRQEDAKKNGDFEQLLKSSELEREKLQAELDGIRKQATENKLSDFAMKEALKFTKDVDRAELLAEKFKQRMRIDGDDVKVTDENGNLTVSPVEEMTKSITSKYPFLVDGKGSTGGSAFGNTGGASVVKKYSEYTDRELIDLKNNQPDAYTKVMAEAGNT